MSFIHQRPRLATVLAWALFLISAGFAVAGTVLNALIGDYGEDNSAINKWSVATAALGVSMPVVGALIASRRPENLSAGCSAASA